MTVAEARPAGQRLRDLEARLSGRIFHRNAPGRRSTGVLFVLRKLLVLANVPLAVVLCVTAATAFFTTTGSGYATATIGSLSAPGAPTATSGAGSVALNWSTVSPPTGTGTVSYYVKRDGANAGGNCPTQASPSTATSCSDSGLSAGTYHYTVTAGWQSWSAASTSTTGTVASRALDHFSPTAATPTPPPGAAGKLTHTAKEFARHTGTGHGGGP